MDYEDLKKLPYVSLYDVEPKKQLEIAEWCYMSGLSLVGDDYLQDPHYVDIADFSYVHDTISTFYFTDEKDVSVFLLKWSEYSVW